MNAGKLFFIGFVGAIASIFVLALASFVSGVATWDARDFMGGYRDMDSLVPTFFVPGISVLLGTFVAVTWTKLDERSFQVPCVLLLTFFSSLGLGELGMNVTNIQPGPVALLIFYAVYLGFVAVCILAVRYHQKILNCLATILSWQRLQPHRQGF